MFSFLIGKTPNISIKVNFEDVQTIIKDKRYLLISTLDTSEQNCLISGTINCEKEVDTINSIKNKGVGIVIYGRNTNDKSLITKYNQLLNLGFSKVYIYQGGLFEWLCLQDIYGKNSFPTMGEELDILKYRALPELCKNLYIEDK